MEKINEILCNIFLAQMRIIIKYENSYLFLKTLIIDDSGKIINYFYESKEYTIFVTLIFMSCSIKMVIASKNHTAVYFSILKYYTF